VDDYKSGKSITFLVPEKNKVKIEDKSIEFNPKEGEKFKNCIALVEGYEDALNGIGGNVTEERTTITIDGQQVKSSADLTIGDTGYGYLAISLPEKFTDKNVVFKHANPIKEEVGDLFELAAEGFDKTLANIAASAKVDGVYAFSREGFFYAFSGEGGKQKVGAKVDMSIFFNNDTAKNKKAYRLIWDKKLDSSKTNDKALIDSYLKLANLLNSTGESVTATGSFIEGKDTYTKKLGENRALTLARFLKGLDIKKVETKSDTVAEIKDSKATIALNADYIILDKKEVAALPEVSGENCFLPTNKNKVEATAQITGVDIKTDAASVTLAAIKTAIESNATLKDQYLFELLDNGKLLYALSKKAMLSFQLLSKESSDLKVEAEKNEKENSILIKDDFNPASKLKTESPDSKDSKDSKDSSGTKETFAIGATIDVRYTRQFDMSMEGNASMSAKLKSVPPPEAFKAFVEKVK
jgi:hypothetical protein